MALFTLTSNLKTTVAKVLLRKKKECNPLISSGLLELGKLIKLPLYLAGTRLLLVT